MTADVASLLASETAGPVENVVAGGVLVELVLTAVALSGAMILNHENRSMDQLGDIAGHGLGRTSESLSIAVDL